MTQTPTKPKSMTNSTRNTGLVTLIAEIVPNFIEEQYRSFNPAFEPGVIEVSIERDGEIITGSFYRTGLVFSVVQTEVSKWVEALNEASWAIKITDTCRVLNGDGFHSHNYSKRDAAVITTTINANPGLKVLLADAFNEIAVKSKI